jgi:hypothetical protein|tara:strand:- start:423 stop:611 length:189 start_codon:yes stop_codon:yes gene_type:complete
MAKKKRYNLVIPEALYVELATVAEREHMTVVALMRRYLKLGLLFTQGDLVVRTRDGREVTLG